MINKTNIHLYAATLLAGVGLAATAHAAENATAGEQAEPPLYRPFALSLDAGTTGFGGSGSWRFADHWGARLGADYLSFSNTGVQIQDLHYSGTLRLLSEPLTLDIYPWQTSSFRISVGLMLNQNRFTGTADSAVVGQLDAKIEQQPVNPYLSIGGNFFYFDHAHHWAFGGELGVAYTGDPQTSLTSSGTPGPGGAAAIAIAQQQLDKYAEKFMWWPVAKLQVTYSF